MSERNHMLGRLSVLKQERLALTMRIDGLCKSIRSEINPMLYDQTEMNVPLAAQQMDDLTMAQAELMSKGSKIDRLKKELGIG